MGVANRNGLHAGKPGGDIAHNRTSAQTAQYKPRGNKLEVNMGKDEDRDASAFAQDRVSTKIAPR